MKKLNEIIETLHTLEGPEGYKVELLQRNEISSVCSSIKQWYPDIVVGAESRHLEPLFYEDVVFFDPDKLNRDVVAFTYKKANEIVGFLSLEINDGSRTLTALMGVISPAERGAKLGHLNFEIMDTLAKVLGVELLYGYATLKSPHQQVIAEKNGYQLVGIVPAVDRDMVRPGTIKRVFEALYAKPLVPSVEIEIPEPKNLTPTTQALFSFLFKK